MTVSSSNGCSPPRETSLPVSSPPPSPPSPPPPASPKQLTRTQALMEAVLPECQTLDRLCTRRDSNNTVVTSHDDLVQQQQQLQAATPTAPAEDNSPIARHTDLSDPSLKIWVVTTAALPWRTGTSVNPLARALYLTDNRPDHYVTLVVPFLTNLSEQAKIFPKGVAFATPQEQELWIRTYCAERVHCPEREARLNILFYEATYNPSFASIFATEDICALIPSQDAHVCILEEPEHLNWMRVVQDTNNNIKGDDDASNSLDNNQIMVETIQLGWQAKFNYVVGILHTNYDAYVRQYGMGTAFLAASALHALSAMCTRAYCHRVIRLSDTLPTLDPSKEITCNVHGVLMEFLQDPPLPASTSSEQVAGFASTAEDDNDGANNDPSLSPIYFIGKLVWAKGFDKLLDIQELYKSITGQYFSMDIYGSGPDDQILQRAFFGRKGILEASVREKKPGSSITANTPDRNAKQIFEASSNLRDQVLTSLSTTNPTNDNQEGEKAIEVVWDDDVDPVVAPTESMEQQLILASRKKEQSIDDDALSSPTEEVAEPSTPNSAVGDDDIELPLVMPISPTSEQLSPLQLPLSPTTQLSPLQRPLSPLGDFPNPFVILSELSSQFVGTGFFATKAVSKIGKDTVGYGLNALSSERSPSESSSEAGSESEINTEGEEEKATSNASVPTAAAAIDRDGPSAKRKHHRRLRLFDPIKSRYELRRHPIPARFMGMKDHAVLKQVPKHKIFLNPSKSEVLCTTSAEALAMGKFVILPKHPSNSFFYQFENCLAYESKKDCVEKIRWALANDPKPLSDEERFQLTWEGANDRLFKAAAMTEKEVEDWRNQRQASDRDAAKLHYETVKRGRGVQQLLHRSSSLLSKKGSTLLKTVSSVSTNPGGA